MTTGNPLTGTAASPMPQRTDTPTVRNDGWWPDVDMAHLRDAVRVPAGVTDARIVEATCTAVLDVNMELSAWKAKRQAEGCKALNDVPGGEINGKHELWLRYRQAVYSLVEALLIEQYRSMDSTGSADKRADMLDPRATESRRNKHWAVRAILAHVNPNAPQAPHPRATVDLL